MAPAQNASLSPQQLESAFIAALDRNAGDLSVTIVNTPFQEPLKIQTALLFLGIVVLLKVDPVSGMIDRVALSNTELARNTTDVSFVEFGDIKIPTSHDQNIIAQAIKTGEPMSTTDWKTLFEPALTPEQARINQASGGIAYSAVYPLKAGDGGALIFSYFQYQSKIGVPQKRFMEAYTALVDAYLAKN